MKIKAIMERKTAPKALTDLILAALMGEGEIYINEKNEMGIYAPFCLTKAQYIHNYILHHSLDDYVELEKRRGYLYIFPQPIIKKLSQQWFKNQEKIFSNQLNPNLLTFQAILIWINLFGSRNLDSVVIGTTVVKPYLRNLSYCIEKHIHTAVIPNHNSLKIHDIESLFLTTMKHSINDCTYIAAFLTQKEMKAINTHPMAKEGGGEFI